MVDLSSFSSHGFFDLSSQCEGQPQRRRKLWVSIGSLGLLASTVQAVDGQPTITPPAAIQPAAAPPAIATPGSRTDAVIFDGPVVISPQQQAFLLQQARAITVKIELPTGQGSGVIIQRNRDTYQVITNAHVVEGSSQIVVQTPEGRRHSARQNTAVNFGQVDLALLEFDSAQVEYPVATLGSGLTTPNGTPVLSAGFPQVWQASERLQPFQLTSGYVSQIMKRSLNGGNQVGYSNWVAKGMSGGPVINLAGQVIAINGLHADPLWGNPYRWDDGSVPPDSLLPVLSGSSWAIPTETILKAIAPQSSTP